MKCLIKLAVLIIVVNLADGFTYQRTVRSSDICGYHNGHRKYLELGESGQLSATNITVPTVCHYWFSQSLIGLSLSISDFCKSLHIAIILKRKIFSIRSFKCIYILAILSTFRRSPRSSTNRWPCTALWSSSHVLIALSSWSSITSIFHRIASRRRTVLEFVDATTSCSVSRRTTRSRTSCTTAEVSWPTRPKRDRFRLSLSIGTTTLTLFSWSTHRNVSWLVEK